MLSRQGIFSWKLHEVSILLASITGNNCAYNNMFRSYKKMLSCLQGFVVVAVIYFCRTRFVDFQKTYQSHHRTVEDLQANNETFNTTSPTALPVMRDCPPGWRYEVLRYDSNGLPEAQICRSKSGNNHWICAEGWEPLLEDPYCVKVSTSAHSYPSVSTFEGEFETLQANHCRLVANEPKLLFYQLPGSSVDVSPSVFSVLHENGELDQGIIDQYQKFTFIEHPCSRLIKLWEDISYWSVNTSFTSFLNDRLLQEKPLLLSDKLHFKSQTDMLFDSDGSFRLDQCLVMESWNNSLFQLMEKANLDHRTLQLLEIKAPNNRKCRHMYTQDTWRKMIYSYAMDFCVFRYSVHVREANKPPLGITVQSLETRYKFCSDQTKASIMNNILSPFVSTISCTIHTYYQPAFYDAVNNITNQNVLRVWEKAWASAGWQTRVLNESDAMSHPEYEDLKKKFQFLPTVNSRKYELACFLRYLAMAVVGGGWMSDFDTLPLHLPTCSKIPFNGSFTLWSAYVPCLVSASGNEYTRMANVLAEEGLRWQWHPLHFRHNISGFPQVSDMKVFSLLLVQHRVRSLEVVIETDDLLSEGFACNKSVRLLEGDNSTPIPEGMPLLPWGVHISHNFMKCIKNRNIPLWQGISWDKEELTPSPSFRKKVIEYVYRIYLQKCNLTSTINSREFSTEYLLPRNLDKTQSPMRETSHDVQQKTLFDFSQPYLKNLFRLFIDKIGFAF